MVGRWRSQRDSRNGCVTRYSWANGTTGIRTPASRPSSAAYIPPALTTTSASMSPLSVRTPRTRPSRTSIPVTRVFGVDRAAAAPRAVGERVGQLRRVQVAVGRQPGGAEHAVGDHQREALLRLLGRDQLQREPERLRPAGLAPRLLPALRRAGEPDAAALGPAGVELAAAELPVELDRVHHHLRQRHARPELADQPRGVERRAARELVAVEQHDVAPAQLGQVVGDRRPADAAADDHAARGRGQVTAPASSSQAGKRGSARPAATRARCSSA